MAFLLFFRRTCNNANPAQTRHGHLFPSPRTACVSAAHQFLDKPLQGRRVDFPNSRSKQEKTVELTATTSSRTSNNLVDRSKESALMLPVKDETDGLVAESTPIGKESSSTTPLLPRQHQHQHQHQQHQHHQPQQQQHQRQNNQQHQQHEQQQNRQDSERPSGNSREPTAENKRPRKHEFRRCQKQHPPCKADAAIRTRSTKNTAAALGGPDLTQALTRVSKLKSTLGKAADPPEVAAEMAALYLVLSDHKAALTSFRLAMKPSPGE